MSREQSLLIFGRRAAAYLLDWLVSLIAGWILVVLAASILLLASHLDRRDAPDWALYLAIVLVSAWLPVWYIYTSLAWAFRGTTLGMLCAGLRVVQRNGATPGIGRSALRAGSLAVFSAPALLSPFLVAAAISLGTPGGGIVVSICVLLILASATACLSPFLAADGRAWHDRLSGTLVVRVASRVR